MIIPNDISSREKLIIKELSALRNTNIKCPCLGGVPVKIIGNSIVEIAHHASKSKASTIAALNLRKILTKASFYKMRLPKNNKQTKTFHFIFMYELHGNTSYGTSKIMIGVRENAKFLQYCITVI